MILAIMIILFLFSLILGFLLFKKPELAIEIQRKFYAKINWKIEPISMKKEIRNTKLMGLFLVIISLFAISYIVVKSASCF